MKQLMFIALALLLAACEKPVLDNDADGTKVKTVGRPNSKGAE